VKRREFITLIGGAAVPWPGVLRAQQTLPVIGFLNGGSPFAPYLIGLRQGLKAGGYVEGQNVLIEYRWAEGRYDRLPAMAAELVARNVRVLVVNTPASKPAQAATKTVPIVFVVGADPVELDGKHLQGRFAAVLKAVASGPAMACVRLVGLGRGSYWRHVTDLVSRRPAGAR
jgi:putative tryptophan/tyrosine transport system substrate-binding protein